jgi:large subunit ribosomal protein L6
MSRIGKRKIVFNDNVKVHLSGDSLLLSSDKGEMKISIPPELKINLSDNSLLCDRINDEKKSRALQGLVARIINTRMDDLSNGFKKTLEFKGTGFRARVENGKLILSMGFSHEIELGIPEGVEVSVVKNQIVISGSHRNLIGEFAARVREVRPPEVYKGKGIRYIDEHVRRKAGKAAQTVGAK